MYIMMSESLVKIIIATHGNLKTNPAYETGQKSPLQHSLFWRYANSSKLIERGEDLNFYKKSINLQIIDILLSL